MASAGVQTSMLLINVRPLSWPCDGTMVQNFCCISTVGEAQADLDLPQRAHKEQISLPLQMWRFAMAMESCERMML